MKKSFTLKYKLLEVMKVCCLQVAMAITLVTLAFAHDNFAQVLDKKITVNFKEVPIEEALDAIGAAAGVKFFYSIDQLNVKEKLSVKAVNRSLGQILDDLLSPYHVKYKVHEKKGQITLKRQEEEARSSLNMPDTGERLPSLPPRPSAATITGTVTDAATGQPMAGVNIIVRGTTEGTTTDAEGRFSIWATDKDVLVFSFIGFVTFETLINGSTVIDVALRQDVKNLGEVVVRAGYWDVKNSERTGNIGKVTADDIQKQPVQNAIAALQGRIPGLEITQQNGVPGGNFKVRIRGTNSIANGNDPLYIIDGVPFMSSSMSMLETSGSILGTSRAGQGYSPLNSLNPNDIESIEVLKDADATAIYGSRGSNGVILITTKRGQAGQSKVNVNFYSGAAAVTRQMDLLNTEEYLQMRHEAFKNDNVAPTSGNARDLLVWDTTRYTNWQKELIGGTAHTTDAQISISGGDKSTQFSFGTGYHKETAVFPGDNSDRRISTHVSISNVSSNEKFKSSISLTSSINDTDLIKKDLTSTALILPPNAPALYDETGKLSWKDWSQIYENPLAFLKRKYEGNTTSFIGNSVAGYSILHNLELKSSFGYTSMRAEAVTMTPISSLAPAQASTAQNQSYFSNASFKSWIMEPQMNWKPKLGGGRFDVLVGTTFLEQTTEGIAQSAYGFTSEALMKNLGAAPNRSLGTNYYTQYRYNAIFGRVNYIYLDKYIINLTARRDGSSRFGPGKQFANFSALGAAWLFSSENFIKDGLPFLSFGKLRASYGTTGNDQLGDYQFLDTYTFSSGVYQGQIGLTPVRLSNPNYAWETNEKLEGGLELGFLNDRILIAASYYHNRSSDQLIGFPLPPTTGFTNIQGNFPATVQNTGVEVEITTQNIGASAFTWATSVNISIPRNKLTEFPNLEASPTYANTYVVGEPLSIRKLYTYTGTDPITGLYTFEDVDGDGTYSTPDRQAIEFIGPDFYGGLLNTLKYRHFQLDFLFQFVKQNGYDYQVSYDLAPGSLSNQSKFVMDRWTREGDGSDVQRFTNTLYQSAYTRLVSSDRSVCDASFVRLKNLSLAYTLPQHWPGGIYVTNARLFVTAQNLLTLTNYRGLDPETQRNNLPPLRVLTAGASFTF
jgi:TonB-linked SusC/RagA family outer membrane protein